MTEATGFEAKTIHRLLEVDPKGGGFKRGFDARRTSHPSPFPERLAPQSLILEVIGLGRAGPHCMAAYHSQSLRRSARPDPTGLIRPRGALSRKRS